MILAWYRYGAVRGMCPVLTSGIIINPTSSIILLERMGNSQFSSSVEADDLFAARWSLVSALKQQQCSDQEIQRLLGHMHKTYGDDANPDSGFAAVMTCSSADKGCPIVYGAAARFATPYVDPKVSDEPTKRL